MILWSGFFVCTAAILYSGTKLVKYGDVIAEKTGMGRTLVGLILMATVTSLPELTTGISAVTIKRLPDIAAGSVIGSCSFNLLILASLDALYRQMPLSTKAHHGHILAGGISVLMLSIVAMSIYLGEGIYPLGWIGVYSVVFGLIYIIAMKLIFIYEKRQHTAYMKEVAQEKRYDKISKKTAYKNYAVNAVVVIVAGIFLPGIGEGIAEQTGLGQTFVGNILIAFATSLPEVVVSIMAVRMDAVNLAIGNLFGSNIFNIFILAIDDLFFIKGPILSYASPNNIIPALSAIAMTTAAIIGLTYRAEKKAFFLAWDSIVMVGIFVINLMLLYGLK